MGKPELVNAVLRYEPIVSKLAGTMRRKLLVTLLAAVVLAGGLVVLLTGPARRAESCLRELRNVEVGKTTDSDLAKNAFFKATTRDCNENRCSYVFIVDNHLLAALHISPVTEMRATVTEERGLVSDIWIHGVVGSAAPVAMVTAQQHASALDCMEVPCVKIARKYSSGPELAWATVVFGGSGNKIGTAVNAQCLSKIGGCKDATEFMPLISTYRH